MITILFPIEMPKIQNPSPGTRGEPDRVRVSDGGKEPLFRDDLAVSPAWRGNLCCDGAALKKRIGNPPKGGAVEQAQALGVGLMTELLCRRPRERGAFDAKTAGRVAAPEEMRERILCHRLLRRHMRILKTERIRDNMGEENRDYLPPGRKEIHQTVIVLRMKYDEKIPVSCAVCFAAAPVMFRRCRECFRG